MKIRTGFVSNSSSSSYIIAWKGDFEKLVPDILKNLKIPKDSPLYEYLSKLILTLHNGGSHYENVEHYIERQEWYDEKNDDVVPLLKAGWQVCKGEIESQENYDLARLALNLDTKNYKIIKSGSW